MLVHILLFTFTKIVCVHVEHSGTVGWLDVFFIVRRTVDSLSV